MPVADPFGQRRHWKLCLILPLSFAKAKMCMEYTSRRFRNGWRDNPASKSVALGQNILTNTAHGERTAQLKMSGSEKDRAVSPRRVQLGQHGIPQVPPDRRSRQPHLRVVLIEFRRNGGKETEIPGYR